MNAPGILAVCVTAMLLTLIILLLRELPPA